MPAEAAASAYHDDGDGNGDGMSLAIVRESLAGVLGEQAAAALAPDDPLITSGRLGSLDVVGLIVAIESRLGRRLPDTSLVLAHFETPRKIGRLIEHVQRSDDPEALLSSNEVAPLDDRQRAALLFQQHAPSIDLLMIGSSRTCYASARAAAAMGFAAFNFWSLGSRAEDWYCTMRFVLDEHDRLGGARLRAVVLGIDAEAFTPTYGVEPFLTYSPLLSRYLDDATPSLLADAAGQDARVENVRLQLRVAAEAPDLVTRQLRVFRLPRVATRDPIAHPASTPLLTPDDRNVQYAMRYKDFDRLAEWRVDYFRRFLAIVRERSLPLVCYVTPVHHVLHEFLRGETTYTERLSEIREIVAMDAPSAIWLDLSTVEGFGGIPEGFENGAHVNPENGETLTRRVVNELQRLLQTNHEIEAA